MREDGEALPAPTLFLETRSIMNCQEITKRPVEAKQEGLSFFYKHTTKQADLIMTFNLLTTDFFFLILAHLVFKMWVIQKHCAQRERLRVAKSLAHNIKQGPVGQAQLLNKCPMVYGSETFIHILFLIPPTNAHKCLLQ